MSLLKSPHNSADGLMVPVDNVATPLSPLEKDTDYQQGCIYRPINSRDLFQMAIITQSEP